MEKEDKKATKGFVELRIVEVVNAKVEFVKKGTNVGVYYESQPTLKDHVIRPVFEC